VFTNAWSRNNQLIRLDPLQSTSVVLAAAHIARGNTTLTDIKRNIERYLIHFTFLNRYTVFNNLFYINYDYIIFVGFKTSQSLLRGVGIV